MVSKNTICLWYGGNALDAATFCAKTFPHSALRAVHRARGDYPAGKHGDVLKVRFTVMRIPCLELKGLPGKRLPLVQGSSGVCRAESHHGL